MRVRSLLAQILLCCSLDVACSPAPVAQVFLSNVIRDTVSIESCLRRLAQQLCSSALQSHTTPKVSCKNAAQVASSCCSIVATLYCELAAHNGSGIPSLVLTGAVVPICIAAHVAVQPYRNQLSCHFGPGQNAHVAPDQRQGYNEQPL